MTERNTKPPLLIAWPAMLKLANEDDVLIVSSWEEWVRDHDLSGYDEPGVLIAGDGQVYDLKFEPKRQLLSWLGPKGFQRPVPRGERISTEELLEFLRPQVEALGTQTEAEIDRLAQNYDARSLPTKIIVYLKEML